MLITGPGITSWGPWSSALGLSKAGEEASAGSQSVGLGRQMPVTDSACESQQSTHGGPTPLVGIPTNRTPKWGCMAFMACFLKGEGPSGDSDRPPETAVANQPPISLAKDGEGSLGHDAG